MGRLPRVHLPGYPHHVVMRCNNREHLLGQEQDRSKLLEFVGRFKSRHKAKLHAYTIMSNHVHLIWDPGQEVSLPDQMRDIMTNFAKWFNWRHSRKGHFWESRYHSSVIQDDSYALTCMRYIHRNPARAGLVEFPWDYPGSSVRHNAFGEPDALVDDLPSFLGLSPYPKVRQRIYRQWVKSAFEQEKQKGTFYEPFLGSDSFRSRMLATYGFLKRRTK